MGNAKVGSSRGQLNGIGVSNVVAELIAAQNVGVLARARIVSLSLPAKVLQKRKSGDQLLLRPRRKLRPKRKIEIPLEPAKPSRALYPFSEIRKKSAEHSSKFGTSLYQK
jgi:hypothetical protein